MESFYPWCVLIIKEREARLWTQDELGEKLGTDGRTIRSWERGEVIPGKYYRRELSKIYGKEPEDLLLDEETVQRAKRGIKTLSSNNTEDNSLSNRDDDGYTETSAITYNREKGASGSIEHETRPQSNGSYSQTKRFGDPFPEIWNVARRHSLSFTGRDSILQQLFDGFVFDNTTGMVTSQAITGLGGMGKTQTAAEYAIRYRQHYKAVLWARAQTQEDLVASFQTIADMLAHPQAAPQDLTRLIQMMQKWFITQSAWLLILDNADNLTVLDSFLPQAARGHILLTSRTGAIDAQAQPLTLEPLHPEDGAICILRRSGLLRAQTPLSQLSPTDVGAAQQLSQSMGGLPLALEQAGAYINDTGCGVRRYHSLYQDYRARLLEKQHGEVPDYPESVASAWNVSRQTVENINPAGAELLRLCAFLAPDAIPEELLIQGAPALGPVLGSVVTNDVELNNAIGILRKYSLLNRENDEKTTFARLSIHQIMQTILRDQMDEATQQLWAKRAVQAVSHVLSTLPHSLIQAHVRYCAEFIRRLHMTFPEAKAVLHYSEETENTETQ